tara:strand:- start:15556 stop:16311 length:756 start_codon:yes stop_codon:yes gene_type:complete
MNTLKKWQTLLSIRDWIIAVQPAEYSRDFTFRKINADKKIATIYHYEEIQEYDIVNSLLYIVFPDLNPDETVKDYEQWIDDVTCNLLDPNCDFEGKYDDDWKDLYKSVTTEKVSYRPHKVVYEVIICILLILNVLLTNKLYNLENIMEIKTKYYKPLDSRLTIKQSNIDGLGLFAVTDIKEGEVLGISHVYDERFKDRFIRTPLGGFINHSKEPNLEAKIDGDYRYVKTLKNIEEGEELTLLYNLYNLGNE